MDDLTGWVKATPLICVNSIFKFKVYMTSRIKGQKERWQNHSLLPHNLGQMCLVLHSGTATDERKRSSHLCDQTRSTSRSTGQDKQTETNSVYGRGLPLAEVRQKPWGKVTICNTEALMRGDLAEGKVWQRLKDCRHLSLILCAHMCVVMIHIEEQKVQCPLWWISDLAFT